MSDRKPESGEGPTASPRPRIRAALETIASPEARHLPRGWAAVLDGARGYLTAAADTLRTIPAEPSEDELWRQGMPVAGALHSLIYSSGDGALALTETALARLDLDGAATKLAASLAEAMADGELAGPDGVADLLDCAEAVRRRQE